MMLCPGDVILRSDRRSFCVEIGPGGKLTLRVPRRATQREIDAFLASKAAWIARHRASPPPADPRENLSEAQIAELRASAQQEIPQIVCKWAELVGETPDSIRITAAKRRFGSCSGRANLCFSLFLMLWPREAVEYVAVHELCHIRHKNHGAQFYRAIEAVMPDWRRRAALLKELPNE